MENKIYKLEIGEIDSNKIALSPKDAKKLDFSIGDLCTITFPVTMRDIIAKVIINKNVGKGSFKVNSDTAFQLGIEEGFECTLKKFDKPIKALKGVTLRIDSAGDKPIDLARYVTDEREKVLDFMQDKLIRKDLSLINQELGIIVEVYDTDPQLSGDEIAIFDEIEKIKITQKYNNYFNGILLIDSSSSMLSTNERDMMDPMTNEEFLKTLSRAGGYVKDYIDKYINGKKKIRRFDSAILATLAFLNVKIAKGRGEKISIILYSNDADPISLVIDGRTRPWVSSSGLDLGGRDSVTEILTTELLSKIDKLESAKTNIEASLIKAREICDDMEKYELEDSNTPQDIHGKPITNPTIIILLTDGRRTVGRAPVAVVKELFANRPKTIVHTIGLGDDVEEEELIEIARLSRGKYFNTRDAQELLKFYDKEATDFTSVKSKSAFEEIVKKLKDLKTPGE